MSVSSSQQHDLDHLNTTSVQPLEQFRQGGDLIDLENVISHQTRAVELTNDGHPSKPMYLSNLGNSQETRFGYLGDLADLENAIFNKTKAVELIDDEHPSKPMYLSNLGISQETRFGRLGDLADLDNAIFNKTKAVELTSDGHPSKPMYLSNLGISQETRFGRFEDLADLQNAIINKTKAVELTNDGHPDKPMYLSNLGISQETCFRRCGDLADLNNAISNKTKAVELTDDNHPSKPGRLSNLGVSQETHFGHLGDLADLDNAISNQTKAVELTNDEHPSKPMYLSNLGISQETHFGRLGDLADLDHAIFNKTKAVELTKDGHPSKPMYLSNLETRFGRLGDLADLDNAIINKTKAVQLTDDNHPSKPGRLSNLGVSQETRFEHLGNLADLENVISNQTKAVELTNDGHPFKPMYLSNLGISQEARFGRLGDLVDLENAIINNTKAVELTSDGHPSKPMYLSNLGKSQITCFKHLEHLVDLEKALLNMQTAVDLTDMGDPYRSERLLILGTCFKSHSVDKGSNHLAAISAFKEAAYSPTAYPSIAFKAAREWADTSCYSGDLLSALEGYRTALKILPKVAWLGLDQPSHHNQLLQTKSENLGCLAAACAIQLGHLEEAVELLDSARSVYWQQVSSLRSDLGALKQKNEELANELETIGRQLDAGSLPNSNLIGKESIVKSSEDVGKQRRDLVSEWERLVERVRKLPGFTYFLRPTPFHQLRQAVTIGRVIVINISELRVDALIFGRTGSIEHVPLPVINLKKFTKMAGNIMLNRSADSRSVAEVRAQRRKYMDDNLQQALRMVWDMVLVPIFNQIQIPLERQVGFPQHRIWWYTTGPLTFIPIHAAGPDKGAVDVSRMVISSYVTTLDSLFKAQQKAVQAPSGQQRLVAISQPNTPGQSPIPNCTQEVLHVVEGAATAGWVKEDIVHLHGADATVEHVLTALDTCSWAHFACHGFQDPMLGMKSAFALHNGHLELGQIVSKQLSIGQFAFLSACHAASGLKELPGEAMHLAAGLQFAGFLSVIATMWGIHDEDAPKVADHTYQYLLRNGKDGLDPSDAATALNRAVQALREDPDMTIDRWAPFIHFGI
ncbi:hypothetical protein PILCRDRAFT_73287 [Piloderma croceum F 1598]|uniref:CHAT domain-containing protein n=1 Tax=Piloderma croceum (strain F 1598) TaxID=765440 RepID=A0A0C3FK79_PILCF|nr:hypothetical protein PILCRDRAFT_73287 [Piloderma croceum F 1598]